MKRAYLDDVRETPDGFDVAWRDTFEAVEWMGTHGCPAFISFDHDLGEEPGGYSFHEKPNGFQLVKWMVAEDIARGGGFIPKDFTFHVHSANPVGAKNIFEYLTQYLSMRGAE